MSARSQRTAAAQERGPPDWCVAAAQERGPPVLCCHVRSGRVALGLATLLRKAPRFARRATRRLRRGRIPARPPSTKTERNETMNRVKTKSGVRVMPAYVTNGAAVGVTTARKAQSWGHIDEVVVGSWWLVVGRGDGQARPPPRDQARVEPGGVRGALPSRGVRITLTRGLSYPHGGLELPSRRVRVTLTRGLGYPHGGFEPPSPAKQRTCNDGPARVRRAIFQYRLQGDGGQGGVHGGRGAHLRVRDAGRGRAAGDGQCHGPLAELVASG